RASWPTPIRSVSSTRRRPRPRRCWRRSGARPPRPNGSVRPIDQGVQGMILVVDHYDSFVYNLVQLVEGLGYDTEVVRSDAERTDALLARRPDAVILSPGPGRPEDAGCMVELAGALDPSTPVLGVCLGHQAIGAALGGRVDRGPKPVHGKA